MDCVVWSNASNNVDYYRQKKLLFFDTGCSNAAGIYSTASHHVYDGDVPVHHQFVVDSPFENVDFQFNNFIATA